MSRHVAIIGGGIIGLCTAYYAAQRGFRVTLVDRNPPQRDGCSFGNAGMIVPSHFIPLATPGAVALGLKWMWNPESPFYIKPRLSWDLLTWAARFWQAATPARVKAAMPILRYSSLASRQCFEELAADPGNDFGLQKRGLLMLCKEQHTLDEEAATAELARELGIPAEVLDARATSALEPGVMMDICGSVYFPKDCHLDPGRLMHQLQQTLLESGADFRWQTELTGWRTEGDRIVAAETSSGEIEADQFVICGGSWSPGLTSGLRLNLPLQPGKGYSLTLPNPRRQLTICSILTEARVAVTPMGGQLRVGGTMEIAGLNSRIDPRRVAGITKAFPRYYPDFATTDFADVKPWYGLRPCSPDGLPYLGRTASSDNLVVATGHAMMGLSLGPITGKLVAGLLSGEVLPIDLRLLSPDRYA